MNDEYLEVAERFCGPPGSGNGGYVCGLIARRLPGAVSVRLKVPPPLNTPMRREWTTDGARLWHESTVVGEARRSSLALDPPAPPSLGEAEGAAGSYPGFKSHLFPRCFVCGPARLVGDGLRIFPGALEGGSTYAAPWVPDPSLADATGQVASEFIWAALDCPSAFAQPWQLPEGMAMVLGELCASVVGTLAVDRPAVVSSWPIGREGRRRTAGSAIHTPDGELVAMGRAVWIEVPASQWNATTPATRDLDHH